MAKAHDSLTIDGAARLASKIRRYWHEKGRRVDVWIEPLRVKTSEKENPATIYQVRSNMVGGRPAWSTA
jgi:hypothetical protein